MVANDTLLEAYSYVPHDAVWFSFPNEGEMDTVKRVCVWTAEEHARKRTVVRERAARLVERNVELVEEWVKQGFRRTERAGWRMEDGVQIED